MPDSSASSLSSLRRKLSVGVVIATLILLAGTITDLYLGGRPDPPALRAAATLLDGSWIFHTGDDPAWATADVDGKWEFLDLTAPPGSHDGDVGLPDYVGGWMAQGHPEHRGYAWYRRWVTVPAGEAQWDILGPTLVDEGYELYWNGELLGGSGRLGEKPRLVGTRPMIFALPSWAPGARGVLAVRVYLRPGTEPSADGGGMHSAPILAKRPTSIELHRVQWQRTIAGYIVDVIEPLAMLALIGLAVWSWPRSTQRGFLLFASIALALTAGRRLNNAITSWTDLMDLGTYAWLAKVLWIPAVASWTFAWNRWGQPAWKSIDALALAMAAAALAGTATQQEPLITASRIGSIALLVVVSARVLRNGPLRMLAFITLASITAAWFGGELLDPLGVPGIWFPFNIGVSRTQYLYALVIPLVGLLISNAISTPPQDQVHPDPGRR